MANEATFNPESARQREFHHVAGAHPGTFIDNQFFVGIRTPNRRFGSGIRSGAEHSFISEK
jgi:hypothetical protein